MLKSYLKISLRNLLGGKGYTFINITGLAIGMTCFLLILLFVRNELSYDYFHDKRERIYRIGQEIRQNDDARFSAHTQVPLGPSLQNDFPEADRVIRFWRAFRPIIRSGSNPSRESAFYFTDPAVFEVFSFELLEGNPSSALNSPNHVVITESTARRLFGNTSAMGQVLQYEGYPAGARELIITGVVRDVPQNSQFRFDYLASLVGVETEAQNWGSRKPIWTYILLSAGADPAAIESKLSDYIEHYYPTTSSDYLLYLEPLTDIHLFSRFSGGFKPSGDITSVYLFSAIGFFILLIACVNFMNLATARSMRRGREVGLRKVLGAQRNQLIGQFLGEAVMLSMISLFFSLFLLELLLPLFNQEFNSALRLRLSGDVVLVLILLGSVLLVGLLAGSYPAVFLSRYQPVKTLHGRSTPHSGDAKLRKALVVFQFVISIVLIIGTLLVKLQLDYVRHKKLGFDKDMVVVLPHSENETPLLNALSGDTRVTAVSVSQRVPVNDINSDGRTVKVPHLEEPMRVESFIVDDRFLDAYRMKLVAGRGFSHEYASDTAAFVINETAVKAFGWLSPDDAVGQSLRWSGSKDGHIIGVVEDFHTISLHERIEPTVLHMLPDEKWWRTFISARIQAGDLAGILTFLENTWRRYTPDGVYDSFFIDESLAQLHRADQQFGRIFAAFAALAIVIACLGLLGLTAFSAERRTKEIGVRKVLGASVTGIVNLLSLEFVKLVLAANLIAWPVAWYAMNKWLQNFAYRVDISWWVFALAGGLALLIAFATVSVQAIRAALANPVESLRYE
jgi:putative ABC transport system permease protein